MTMLANLLSHDELVKKAFPQEQTILPSSLFLYLYIYLYIYIYISS